MERLDDELPEPNEDIKKAKDDFNWEAAEKRMEIIGQNGNDGEHYADEVEVDPSLTLRQKDGKQINLKDYINNSSITLKGPIDDETKTY